ncbi:MAG: MoaD/ThiS family protein [Candidatus Nanopelagicales bacterium]
MSVTVRYWAAAKAAAGVPEEELEAAGTLAGLLEAVRAAHGEELDRVLGRCSYLVDEVSPGRTPAADVAVPDGSVVDVLPPFAGGSAEHIAVRTALVPA